MSLTYEKYLKKFSEKSLLPGFFTPCYDGLSIVNLTSGLYNILKVKPITDVKPLECLTNVNDEFDAVVLFLIDALGFLDFLNSIDNRLLENIKKYFSIYPITTVAPSTTVTALASLYTGLPPGKHGLVGYRIYFREYGLIVKMIEYSPIIGGYKDSLGDEGIEPREILPYPLIFEILENSGLNSFIAVKKYYQNTMFTELLIGESKIIPYIEMEDMFLNVLEKLRRTRKQLFVSVYWDNLDILGHEYGPDSLVYKEHIRRFFNSFIHFTRKILKFKKRILLLLTADHGHVQVNPKKPFVINKKNPLFKALALPPYGDSRFTYFKTNDKDRFKILAKKYLPKSFKVYESSFLAKKGLFGLDNLHEEILDRIGDFIAIPVDNSYITYSFTETQRETMRGRHAGLSKREMIVPFLLIKH